MKNLILVATLLVASMVSADSISVDKTSLEMMGFEGETIVDQFTVTNLDTVDLVVSAISVQGNFVDSNGSVISFSTTGNVLVLGKGASMDVKLLGSIPSQMCFGSYQGKVLFQVGSTEVEVNINVAISPCPCGGSASGNLKVSVLYYEGDTINIGEDVDFEVKVGYDGQDSVEALVWVALYDVVSGAVIRSESYTCKTWVSKNIEWFLEFSFLGEDILYSLEDGQDCIIYAVAYSPTDSSCVSAHSSKITFRREEHFVRFVDPCPISDSIVTWGDTICVNAHVLNIGKVKEDEVYITLSEPTLLGGANPLVSDTFALNHYGELNNETVKPFKVRIPNGIPLGDYVFFLSAYFDSGRACNGRFLPPIKVVGYKFGTVEINAISVNKGVIINRGQDLDINAEIIGFADIQDVRFKAWVDGYDDTIRAVSELFDVEGGFTQIKTLNIALPGDMDTSKVYTLYLQIVDEENNLEVSYPLKVIDNASNIKGGISATKEKSPLFSFLNPANDFLGKKMYDFNGRLVLPKSSGFYLLKIQNEKGVVYRKVILIK